MKLSYYIFFLLITISISCNQQQYTPVIKKAEREVIERSIVNFRFEDSTEIIFQTYCTSLEKTLANTYIFKRYYPMTSVITHQETYADIAMTIKNGQIVRRFDNGKTWFIGEYTNGKESGEWTYFDYKTGQLASKGIYKNGVKTGIWQDFHSDTTNSITYQFDDKGELNQSNKLIDRMPIFAGSCYKIENHYEAKICSDKAMLSHIYNSIQYPGFAQVNGIEGTAVLQFMIDKEGNVQNIDVLNGISDDIKEECIRIVEQLPTWSPASQNNQPINVLFNLPINFKLASNQ